jgi:hypothetical protein
MERKSIWLTTILLAMVVILFNAGSVFCEPSQVAPAAPYTIQSLNTPDPEFVSSGNSVLVKISGPSTKALQNASVRLNGSDVSYVFAPNGTPGSMTGTVTGLIPGFNFIEVYPSKRSERAFARLTVSTATSPGFSCTGLASLTIPPELLAAPTDVVQITSATLMPETSSLPEHCRVQGKINPRIGVNDTPFAIGFEVRLPAKWSGRFFFQGGGGNDGSYTNATGSPGNGGRATLARGFVTVKSDGGHTGGSAAGFGFDPQARVDHAYNAWDKTTVTAKAISSLYYGRMPDRSYFAGCSGGGRQGMMFTQRFPEYYDGVIAGAPAMSVATGASISVAWEAQTYNAIAPVDAGGNHILSQAFSNSDLTLVANTILQECDSLDGVADGSINNVLECKFDPAALQCTGEKNATCLSAQQVAALKKGFGGPYNSAGQPLYITWPYDTGIGASGWRMWKLGTSATSTPNAAFFTLMQDAIRNEFFTPADPTFSILNFNFDTDPARMAAFGELYDTWKNAELSAFKAHGGKLLIHHGVSDPIFSANESMDYYNRLAAANHGPVQAGAFARLFLVPGMNHCGGGPATDQYDTVSAMINWVENGNAPDKLIASGSSFSGRTRPLCPYPSFARYIGEGSIEDANNFVCELEE